MDWDRWNSWLTLAANLGVLAGLFLIALELNQTRLAMVGAAYQTRASIGMEWNKWLSESDYLVPIIEKLSESGWDSLSFQEQYRVRNSGLAAMYRLDGYYYQYELGLLDQEYYEGQFTAEMRTWVPRWREWGLLDSYTGQVRSSFAEQIQRFMDVDLQY